MQTRSAYFDRTVAGAYDLLVAAELLRDGEVIADGLHVVSGQVDGNRSQFARRTCTVVIGDVDLKPTGLPGDLLAPYGNEIRLYRGAVTPAGDELLPLGTFGIRSAEFDDTGDWAGITITGIDRCKRIAEDRFPLPWSSPAYSSVIEIVKSLILRTIPWADITIDPDLWDVTVPQQTYQQDPATAITDLVTSIGAEMFCDALGGFVIQTVPSPTDPPVFTVTGGQGGILVKARHLLTRDGVFNGVVAQGQSTDPNLTAPVSDLIVDNDPTSPTYWAPDGSGFGHVVGYYSSSALVDYEQCNNAATALLVNQMGAARSINYSTGVNAAIEVGDVVEVVDPFTGQTERHMHDQLSIPLDAKGLATAQTRSSLSPVRQIRRRTIPPFGGALS